MTVWILHLGNREMTSIGLVDSLRDLGLLGPRVLLDPRSSYSLSNKGAWSVL